MKKGINNKANIAASSKNNKIKSSIPAPFQNDQFHKIPKELYFSRSLSSKKIDLETAYDSLVTAAERGCLDTFKNLISAQQSPSDNFSQSLLKTLLLKAGGNNHPRIVKYILSLSLLNKSTIIETFKHALNQKNQLLVQYCLPSLSKNEVKNVFRFFAENNEENALLLAAKFKIWFIVEFFLKNYPNIDIETQVNMILLATRFKQDKLVESFINNISRFDANQISITFMKCSLLGYWSLVKKLLHCSNISSEDKGKALDIAITVNDIAAVKIIIYEGGINKYQMQWALHHAQFSSCPQILNFLQSFMIDIPQRRYGYSL